MSTSPNTPVRNGSSLRLWLMILLLPAMLAAGVVGGLFAMWLTGVQPLPPKPPTEAIFAVGDFVEVKETGARGYVVAEPHYQKYIKEPKSHWVYRVGARKTETLDQDSYWRERDLQPVHQ